MPPRKRLGQLLTELHVVDEYQLQSALGHQKQWGGKLGGILVQKGFCREDQVVNALATHLGMPVVKLATQQVDPRAVKLVSRQIAEKLHVFAYEITGAGRSELVAVAMSDPTDLSSVDQLAFHTGKRIKPMLCGDSEIVNAIVNNYGDRHAAPAPVIPAAAPPPAAASPSATRAFPRRFEPTASRVPLPYAPPPIMARIAEPQPPLAEIEPVVAESLANVPAARPAALAEPLELPDSDGPADGPMEGLEPIAAHAQAPGEEVAGQVDVAGEGSAADALEGLEAANTATRHEGAEQAPIEGLERGDARPDAAAWDSAASSESTEWGIGPATGWDAAPAAEDAPPARAGWGGGPATAAPQSEFGKAQDWGATPDAPEAARAAWGAGEQAAGEPAAAAEESISEELPADAIIGTADALEGGVEAWAHDAPTGEYGLAQEEPPFQGHAAAHEEPAFEEHAAAHEDHFLEEHGAAPLVAPDPPAAGQHEAEAPDTWASSEDPLAAGHEPATAWGEPAAQEPHAEGAGDEASAGSQGVAAGKHAFDEAVVLSGEPLVEERPADEGEAAAEGGAAFEAGTLDQDAVAHEDAALDADDTRPEAGSETGTAESPIEGWVSPLPEPPAGGAIWLGEALAATTPLSPADLDTLAAVGVDVNDGAGAFRLLAAVLRVLQRQNAIDFQELANELEQSRNAALAAGEAPQPPPEDAL